MQQPVAKKTQGQEKKPHLQTRPRSGFTGGQLLPGNLSSGSSLGPEPFCHGAFGAYSVNMNRFLGIIAITGLLVGCVSADPNYETLVYLPPSDSNNRAPGAASSNMMFNKPIPSRPNWKPVDFYYKHCTAMSSRSYYSKTEYDCSRP